MSDIRLTPYELVFVEDWASGLPITAPSRETVQRLLAERDALAAELRKMGAVVTEQRIRLTDYEQHLDDCGECSDCYEDSGRD